MQGSTWEPPPTACEAISARLACLLLCCLDTAVKLMHAVTMVGMSTSVAGAGSASSVAPALPPWRRDPQLPPPLPPWPSQMARRAGLAGAQLVRRAQEAAQPALVAAQAAAGEYAALAQRRDWRGAAVLAMEHARGALVWLVSAVAPLGARLREMASGWHAAHIPTLSTLSAAQLHEKRLRATAAARSSACTACHWASATWAALDRQGKLPAALKRTSFPPCAVYLLLGLGIFSFIGGALLLGFA